MSTLAGVELYDLSPQEAMALVAPDLVWLHMVTGGRLTPLRDRPRRPEYPMVGLPLVCYHTAHGTPVHVQPGCRCRRPA